MINLQDRKDYLARMGVSPGEDDSYNKQRADLIARHGEWVDNTKANIIDRLSRAVQHLGTIGKYPKKPDADTTAIPEIRDTNSYNPIERINILLSNLRAKEAPTGGPTPIEFAGQTLAKAIPTPHELNPETIISSVPEILRGVGEVARHPLATLKHLALNPPAPSTLAAIALPEVGLSAYRNLVPLEARTYLHHMAGIPTPFTHVTEGERAALTELGQKQLDLAERAMGEIQRQNAIRATRLHKIRFMPEDELTKLARDMEYVDTVKNLSTPKLRQFMLEHVELRNPKYTKRDYINVFGRDSDNANVMDDFERITGRRMGATPMPSPIMQDANAAGKRYNFNTALGKTYVEPMIDETGKIVPKSIRDTYKFYPEVYNYNKGEARKTASDIIRNYIESLRLNSLQDNILDIPNSVRSISKDLFSFQAGEPLGIIARKLTFGRPTSIIDIPLRGTAPMNAYDKAAILLGAKPLMNQGQ